MKAMKLLMGCVLCWFMTTAYAQEQVLDTTQNPVREDDPAVRQSAEQVQENDLRDMVKISPNEIPADMQNALKGSDYKGKSKTFYRSKSGDSYLVEIQDGNITHTYRFDKKGKRINDNN